MNFSAEELDENPIMPWEWDIIGETPPVWQATPNNVSDSCQPISDSWSHIDVFDAPVDHPRSAALGAHAVAKSGQYHCHPRMKPPQSLAASSVPASFNRRALQVSDLVAQHPPLQQQVPGRNPSIYPMLVCKIYNIDPWAHLPERFLGVCNDHRKMFQYPL